VNEKRLDRVVFTMLGVLFVVGCVYAFGRLPEKASEWDAIGVFIGAGLTLAVYSFLYRDNPFFKIAENLYVGVGAGYGIWITIYNILIPDLWDPLLRPVVLGFGDPGSFGQADWWLLVPTALGLMMWGRFHAKTEALSRLSFAFIVGMGAGMSIPRYVSAILLKQTYATIHPGLFLNLDTGEAMPAMDWVNAAVVLVGTLCVLAYFFFSVEHRGPVGVASRVGVFFLMVSFGSAFGYTVMARVSLLVGRFQFLLRDWLHLIE